ncbi:hypothetical protein CAEBREN_03388 [Caenorhabditis brenneri]|uniref:Uncharacterized protein n=1 Tax=Caenorhabditis brenneri TaxID=135651 RepID=G0NDN0_CAEBE|nr:hypothetical protein CAEBREN_03388 [Caenorhabditis brenneri]
MDHKAFMLYCLMSTFDCCLCSCYIDLDKAFMLYCLMSTFDCCLCSCYIDLDIKGSIRSQPLKNFCSSRWRFILVQDLTASDGS